ncbi:glutamate--tRNA ligase [Segnochrobactrum spirostomi]|uniref:Glutamate--tRNA ligase n=1 Tax=Segnochrobactrum spirostomi TaxID=2608987 RepID=A0A6A7XXA6_9HYPH|nr:glutamate--tRNA ligase [Segnochrobactrum spirostomi]MQT11230.1 glutamate--tRNA ligase [Segnochrobactrum spirostomi]
MSVIVRFAPSPTGRLHLGNARTALLNYLFARRTGGRFILRLDDTDRERSTEAFARGIVEDLAWLGIEPDLIVRQSDRADRHEAAAQSLRERGLLYGCYETPDELERQRKRRLARHLPPIYDRAGFKLDEAARAALAAEGRRPHWRFLLPSGEGGTSRTVTWDDLVRGPQTVDLASLSDPVLVREDATFLYTLPSVVDDIDLGVTHVVRGEDHVTNTGVQIALFEALGGPVPAFGHHNLLILADGTAMSKRTGTLSLQGLREAGYEPMAIASLAVLVGSAEAVEPVASLEELAERISFDKISRAPARFDPSDLDGLNARLLHGMPYEAARDRLAALDADLGPAFWEAVRANLGQFGEVADWRDVVRGRLPPVAIEAADERAVLAAARELLPPEPWDQTTFKGWTQAITARTGAKGKALFGPLRRAITGRDAGPELARLMPLMGSADMSARLSGF